MQLSRRALLRSGGALTATSILLGRATTTGAPARAPAPGRGGRYAAIDAAIGDAVAQGAVAGVVAVGATERGAVYQGAAGRADVQRGTAMTADTVCWLLSMTKTFTATACMQLVERGRLRLDQDAGELLPQLRAPRVLEGFDAAGRPRLRPARGPITVRHLLTHTAGFTYAIWSDALTRYEHATGMPDIGTCRNAAFEAPLEFDPGARWNYGTGMDWAGKLIEEITDQSLEVYFREQLFGPLGMHDSGFLIGSAQKRRLATVHHRQPDGSLAPMAFEIPQRPEFFMGGAGAFGTPRDYLRFLRMLLGRGRLDGTQLLRPETVDAMMRNQIGELDVVTLRTAQPTLSRDLVPLPAGPHKWGLSFAINQRPGPDGRAAGT